MKKIFNLLLLVSLNSFGYGQDEIVIGGSLKMTLEPNQIQVVNGVTGGVQLNLNPAGGGVNIVTALAISSYSDPGDKILLHSDEILAYRNGSAGMLSLNRLGGNVEFFKSGTGSLIVHGLTVGDYANMQYNTSNKRFYYDSSTRRFKENITALHDDWTKILQVRPVTYTRPGDPMRWEYGYIAEEIDSIGLTSMVGYDEDGNPNDVRYDKMIIYLTEMIKMQQNEINALKNQLPTRRRKKVDQLINETVSLP